MNGTVKSPESRGGRRGFALVLVLGFVTLLVGISLAFLSDSLLQRQVSNSSASQSKVDILAQGAMDITIGDLKKEIADGSSATNTFADGSVLYTITDPQKMVPESVGFQRTGGLENLVSYSGTKLYSAMSADRATDVKTSVPSKNGRFLTDDRWNKPLFLPDAQKNIFDNIKWIPVSRTGANTTGADTIGRYAYVIYDEGGLLDANVAGYPTTMPPAETGYKNGEAYADLHQIGLTDAQVNALVQLRNYATLNGNGSGTSNTPSQKYADYVRQNTVGFLHTANSGLSANGRSDQMFVSRQQMISDFVGNFGWSKDVLQYLTNFSRSLNQPSLAPPASRPKVVTLSSGGNYELGSPSGDPGLGQDDVVNPSLLKVRVLTTKVGGRSDGTNLVAGEPLLKKRFSLNRLAWLTYMGPSKGRTGADITDLQNNFGITQSFLDQGDKATIQRYFGLTWNSGGYWVYDVHRGGSGIKTLQEVTKDGREPDFFEILKATITAGAVGKSGSQSLSPAAVGAQFSRDASIDVQVIQIGANIIDQFDVDGYPTRIQFQPTGLAMQEIRGVENLPYLFRIRNAAMVIKNPITKPPVTGGQQQQTTSASISDPGTVIFMQEPEIWNPHSYNSSDINRSLGNPRPSQLRLYAYSAPPALPPGSPSSSTGYYIRSRAGAAANAHPSSTFCTRDGQTTRMDFQNAGTANPDLYREPTLLIKAGPNGAGVGSALSAPGFVTACQVDGLSVTSDGIQVAPLYNNGSPSSVPASPNSYQGNEPAPVGKYIGLYMGKAPIVWNAASGGSNTTYVAGTIVMSNNSGGNFGGNSFPEMTYQVLCDNPNAAGGFEAYDEKYCIPANETSGPPGTNNMLAGTFCADEMLGWAQFTWSVDPRTSRFGFDFGRVAENGGYQNEISPGSKATNPFQWVDVAHNILPSSRPDFTAGWGILFNAASAIPNGSAGWANWNTANFTPLRYGLLAQNSASAPNDRKRFAADTSLIGASPAQYYADADGVIRRGMAAYMDPSKGLSGGMVGQPLATSFCIPSGNYPDKRQKESRPVILNRPFRTVAELGYVFSGTPWKNLDFSTPESGFAGLLDAFCINDTDNGDGICAGKVNLNTRQLPVLEAILAGAYKDEYTSGSANPLTSSEAQKIATDLLSRTVNAPLANISELTGKWKSGSGVSAVYDGFSKDLTSTDIYTNNIARYRESSIRALNAAGQTRVWNLMIDLIAQTGRNSQSGRSSSEFMVEGEKRYWIHLAIDRLTGAIIDKQIEVVKE